MRDLAFLVLFAGVAVSAPADTRPVVQVVFAFHANTCINYGAARPQEAERFAQVVRAEIADRYQFIDWRTKATLADARPAATLTVQLRARDIGNGVSYYIDYFRDVTLRSGSRITGDARRMRIGESDPIYTWDEFDRPCQDPNFTERLRARINDDMNKSASEMRASLLSQIPIGVHVPEPDPEHTMALKLDLRWREMHAGRNSLLEVDIDGDVKAELKPIRAHDLEQPEPSVCAQIQSFPELDQLTPEKVKAMLDTYRAGQHRVRLFMAQYELNRDAHHDGGRVARVPE